MKSKPISPRLSPHVLLWIAAACLGALLVPALVLWCDGPVVFWVAAHQCKPVKSLARLISQVGDWPSLALLTTVAFFLSAASRQHRWMRILALMFAVSLLAGAVANPVRALTGRARPCAKVEPGWHGPHDGHQWIVGKHKFSSFPSAHTTVAVAIAVPLVLYGRWFGLLGGGLAIAVAWSRIYLNVHHLSDVTAGALVGLGCGLALCLSPVVHFWLGVLLTAFVGAGKNVRAWAEARLSSPARLGRPAALGSPQG